MKKKAACELKYADLKMSKTEIKKRPTWRNIFSTVARLIKILIKPAVKALATAGLSFFSRKSAQENLRQRLLGK